MLARVPAVRCHVDAAARRDFVVDHDNFLVMAAAHRMRCIKFELDLLVHRPFRNINEG